MAENSGKDFLKTVADMAEMVEQSKGYMSDFADSLNAVSSAFDAVNSASSSIEAFAGIGEVMNGLSGAIGNVQTMLAPFTTFVDGFMGALGNIPKGISAAGEKIIGVIAGQDSALSESLQAILGKVVTFSSTFLNCMNFAAGLGLVAAGLGLLYQMFGEQIDQLLLMITEKGPMIITNLCNGIVLALPGLIEQGALLMNGLMMAITANLPAIIGGGFSIISALITGIAQQLPMLIPTALGLILTMVQALIENLPLLIDAGLQLLTGIVQGILNSIPILVAAIPTLIGSLASGIISRIPQIIDTGIKLIFGLATGLIQAIPQIVSSIPQIIDAIKRAFKEVDWLEVGTNIVKGIINGIKNMASAFKTAIIELAKSALNWVKDRLGIASPSKVFRDEVGKMMALGLGIGFEKNMPFSQMNGGIDKAIGRLKKEAGRITSVGITGASAANAAYTSNSMTSWFDFDEYERRQRKLNQERDTRPVFLNSRQINRALRKGEPVTV